MRLVTRGLVTLVAFIALTLTVFRVAAHVREGDDPGTTAPHTGRFVATPDGMLFLQESGPRSGVPVVLIHGTAAWSEFWRGTIDHLAGKGYRVIAVDLPPFGYSDRAPLDGYTREVQARRLAKALQTIGAGKAILVGHSFGAGATVETVMRHPEHVRGLVLVAGALGLPENAAPPEQAPPALAARVLAIPVLGEAIVAATITNPLLTQTGLATMLEKRDAATPELAAVLQRPLRRTGSTGAVTLWLQYFLATDMDAMSIEPGRYARLGVPTRIIWGDRDTLTPLEQGERLRDLVPGSKLTVLPGLGHIPQIEDPASFRPALVRALEEIK